MSDHAVDQHLDFYDHLHEEHEEHLEEQEKEAMSDKIHVHHLVRLGADHRNLLQKDDGQVILYDHQIGAYFTGAAGDAGEGCERIGTVREIKAQLEAVGVRI